MKYLKLCVQILKSTKSNRKTSWTKRNSYEEIFRKFLRKYLPESLDMATGLLVDSKGNFSM